MNGNANNGLLTKIWGPAAWTFLHSCAFGYPLNPTNEDKIHFKNFYDGLKYILPCKYCRDSYSVFITEDDTKLDERALESRDSLTKWLYNIHQKVNNKLNVKYNITYDEYVNKYESFRAKCVKNPIVDGCNMPLKDKSVAFKMAYYKDCPLIEYKIAKKFINYAKKRGLEGADLIFVKNYNNLKNHKMHPNNQQLCEIWYERNKECEKIIKEMRLNSIPSLEETGEYKGFPTLEELKLILNLCSNLPIKELEEIANTLELRSKYIIVNVNNNNL